MNSLPSPQQQIDHVSSQQYSVAIVENLQALQIIARTILLRGQESLRCQHLAGPLQTLDSGRALVEWLDRQPTASVGLLLLDYHLSGDTIIQTLHQISDSERLHPALHPDALVIGWSIRLESAQLFAQTGLVHGFISKNRPAQRLIADILTILERHRQDVAWVELC